MTYYEEFGISSSATPDEISHAHRRLVKILHPDLQMDENARQLAEIQIRRVNAIAEALLVESQRIAYDLSLNAPTQSTTRPSYSPYTFAIAVVLFLGGLYLVPADWWPASWQPVSQASGSKPTERPQAPTHPHPAGRIPVTSAAVVRTAGSNAVPEDALRLSPQPETAAKEPFPTEPTTPERSAPLPGIVAPLVVPANAEPPATLEYSQDPLIGTWVYVPAPIHDRDQNLYRPEYIELRIRNINGILEGQYRARYHVPDRPLSPNVGFHFAGEPGTGVTAFRWNGSNGLGGRVELKLMSTNSIQVDWRVTESTDTADLVSGTAILTRVQ